jgi:GAF domain-containing protein
MKRRSGAGSEQVKGRRRKTVTLLRRSAPKAARSSSNTHETEVARLTRERDEALEQRTAISEVLQVISGSASDPKPVFEAILTKAVRICDANFGNIHRWDGNAFHLVATHNTPPALAEARRHSPLLASPQTAPGRLVLTRTAVHITDLAADRNYIEARDPVYVSGVELGGVRTLLIVPMLREGQLIGSFAVYRQEVRPFTEKQIALAQNFAAQAVIAIENARLLNELRQSLEQQTATADVLQVISNSPGDLEPVFSTMLEKAVGICDAQFGILYLREADGLRLISAHNVPPAFAEAHGRAPFRPAPHGMLDAVMRTGRAVHLADLAEAQSYIERDPRMVEAVEVGGIRTVVGVPLIKDDELVGLMGVYRQEVRPFADKQIELLTNFAAQAVIAIENARLLNELRQRTTDLTDALEQQTATSDVLSIISNSPGELQPVFDAMLANATRLCGASFGTLWLYENDGQIRMAAFHGRLPGDLRGWRVGTMYRPKASVPIARVFQTHKPVQILDLKEDRSYIEADPLAVASVEVGGIRSLIAVPMIKEGTIIGAMTIYRREVRSFSDKQIALVANFAAQAVIAIENARLLNELRQRTDDLSQRTTDLTEALEQQTATSEVLQVIGGSRSDPQPVFEAMLEKAVRVCNATFGDIYRYEGDAIHLVATHNTPAAFVEALRHLPSYFPTSSLSARLLAAKSAVQVVDLAADDDYVERRSSTIVAAVELGGTRTILAVPMLKENELVGVLMLNRKEVRPFSDKQIALVTNFAAQAVIAIENARLLKELRERTEQVEAQSQELVKLNQQLEHRVADQVGEIERMGRLRRFLPPQVADLIIASGSEKQLESHRREITALFCDLRGFTGFTESADAEDVIALLREYHAAIGEKIIKYSGTLERYAGDGVMVVFNDPVPVENPALQAVLMALEMRDAIGVLTGKWRRFGHDIGFGIGIAHGYATLGTIGFEGRFDYAAIGTVSNVASRLCDEAKPGQILINPRVLVAVENAVRVEPVGEFKLKGIRRPLAAYNVVSTKLES